MNCTVTDSSVVMLGYSDSFIRVRMNLCFVLYSTSVAVCNIFLLSFSCLGSKCAVVDPSLKWDVMA